MGAGIAMGVGISVLLGLAAAMWAICKVQDCQDDDRWDGY